MYSTAPKLTSKKVQHKIQNSINIHTNRRINNNALLVQAIQKS